MSGRSLTAWRWLALLLAGILCGSAWADTRPALVVSFRDNPPDLVDYCGNNQSGPLRYAIEEAASRVGYRVEWRNLPLASSLRGLKEQRVDIVPYLFTKTSERAAIGRFSESLGGKMRTVSFFMAKDDARNVRKFADLEQFSIGYRQDSFYFTEFHESKTLNAHAFEKDKDMARAFVAGTINMVVVNNRATIERAFLELGFNEFRYADLSYKRDAQLYLLYSFDARKQAVFDRLDQAIVQMKREGLMADIYRSFDTMPLK